MNHISGSEMSKAVIQMSALCKCVELTQATEWQYSSVDDPTRLDEHVLTFRKISPPHVEPKATKVAALMAAYVAARRPSTEKQQKKDSPVCSPLRATYELRKNKQLEAEKLFMTSTSLPPPD